MQLQLIFFACHIENTSPEQFATGASEERWLSFKWLQPQESESKLNICIDKIGTECKQREKFCLYSHKADQNPQPAWGCSVPLIMVLLMNSALFLMSLENKQS